MHSLTPRQSIERECVRRGTDDVIEGCRRVIHGDLVDPQLVLALGARVWTYRWRSLAEENCTATTVVRLSHER